MMVGLSLHVGAPIGVTHQTVEDLPGPLYSSQLKDIPSSVVRLGAPQSTRISQASDLW